MKFFLDTGNIKDIEAMVPLGIVDGVVAVTAVELLELDRRLDELALQAWDRYAASRDKVSEIRAREATARTYRYLDPTEVAPSGIEAIRDTIRRFIDVGTSKFVLIPVTEPADWTVELEQLAAELLPMQTR